MALKPTRRRAGGFWATISVKHNVSREVVLETIVATLWHEGTPAEDQNELTRVGIEHEVREAYRSHGGEWDIGAGDQLAEMDDDEREEARGWAESELVRLWPEWTA